MIFLSYRRDDSRHLADRIYDRLVAHFGQKVIFKDVDSIAMGVDFRRALKEAVSKCAVVLAVIGHRWVEIRDESGRRRLDDPNDIVRFEIETALRGKTPVVPVLVDGAKMPKPDEIPSSLQDLLFRNGTEVRPDPDFHRDVNRLIEACQHFQPTVEIVSTEAGQASPSVRELIRLIELRADVVLEEMESAKQHARKSFLKSKAPGTATKQSDSSVDLPATYESSLLDSFLRRIDESRHWSFDSVEALCSKLDVLKQSFIKFHNKHKEELCRGNYVAAHELVGQIHTVIERYRNTARPQFLSGKMAVSYMKDVIGGTIREHKNYPGLLPPSLVPALPKELQEHYLIDGDLSVTRQ